MTEDYYRHKIRQQLPELPSEATERQQDLAAKYARVSSILVSGERDASIAWLCVDGQQFRITPDFCDTREDANLTCWMLSKAIEQLLKLEGLNTQEEYRQLWCAVWECPLDEFDGDHQSALEEAHRQARELSKKDKA